MRLLRRRETSEEVVEVADPVNPTSRQMIRRLPFVVNGSVLLLIIALIAMTIFALMLNQGTLPQPVVMWWPLAVAIPSAVSFLIALARRETRRLLASAALFGLSLSMLLASQQIAALPNTFVGITFIAIGTAIILRGLLLSQQPIG